MRCCVGAEWLGKTLPAIAYQKVGILRSKVPAVIASQPGEALRVIREEAERVGSPLIETSACRIYGAGIGGRFPDPPQFDLTTAEGTRFERLELSLRGDHQVDNAAVALLLAMTLRATAGIDVSPRNIARGLARTSWPGRVDLVPGRPELLLDGGHNPEGCRTLAAYLRDHRPRPHTILVFAAMKDKPAGAMLELLAPLMEKTVITSLPVPRAATAEELCRIASGLGIPAIGEPDPARALRRGRAAAGANGLVVVSGSLYLVGEIKKLLASGRLDPETE